MDFIAIECYLSHFSSLCTYSLSFYLLSSCYVDANDEWEKFHRLLYCAITYFCDEMWL